MADTTRRALIAGASAVPAAAMAATPNLPAIIVQQVREQAATPGETRRRDRRDFIERIANWHPDGRLAAMAAMAMELDPADCVGVTVYSHYAQERMPVLTFRPKNKPNRIITVSPTEAWEQGPV